MNTDEKTYEATFEQETRIPAAAKAGITTPVPPISRRRFELADR
jgi:hypothetical protein